MPLRVLWITGTSSNRSQVHVFWSRDPLLRPESWAHAVIHQFPPGLTVCNTSPAMEEPGGKSVVVVAMELGTPAAVRGDGFASIFAVCEGCVAEEVPASPTISGWQLLDPATHIYTKARCSACPTLRWFAGYWCVIVLFRWLPDPAGPNCNADGGPWGGCGAEHVARSKDLVCHGIFDINFGPFLTLFQLCSTPHVLCAVPGMPYLVAMRLFYGCSHRFHLSGDDSRDRYIKGSC